MLLHRGPHRHAGAGAPGAPRGPGWVAAAGLLALPGVAGAASGAVSGAASAWWFACLALLSVGAASYALGQILGRRKLERSLYALRAQQQALLQAQPDLCWHSDAQHQLLQCGGVGAEGGSGFAESSPEKLLPSALPGWFVEPSFQQALAQGRALVGLELTCAPSGATVPDALPQRWLVHAQPLLDYSGRFAGFMGTARALGAPQTAAATQTPAAIDAAAPSVHTPAAAAAGLPALHSALQTPAAPDRPPAALADRAAAAMNSDLQTGTNTGTNTGTTGFTTTGTPPRPDSNPAAAAASPDPSFTASDAEETASFIFTVSHDLRAPIRVVEGFTRIVKEDYGHLLDRVGNDHLDRVLGAGARMTLMIDALLTLASLSRQPLARQPVNLSQTAHYVVDELQRAHPGREVAVDIEEGLRAEGDPTLLRLVLENLLGNAWKYSARNPQAQISLRTVPHGSGRAFVVRDNGAGFDMRAAERLFGLFQRLHSASEFPGHGVGLASVRRIVRRHGGDIWAESEPARGAAFTFTLGGT